MDNVEFHKDPRVIDIIERKDPRVIDIIERQCGARIIFTATYSPDLNPIKFCFHQVHIID